ncbi:hypothetical protein DXG01_001953 [Tephrocybe rancida]|nr:hypothetical protein DXG01_001953 [Tephrocybe rancida]
MLHELVARRLNPQGSNAKRQSLNRSQIRVRPSDETPDKWELDKAFFNALSRWALDHPEGRLESMLKDASDAFDQGKDLLEVIPDAPLPVRSLIKSVVCLFQLGVKIWTAQRDVQDFALEIINWVDRVRESFEQAWFGSFTGMTWKNLSQMRDLINEICSWAAERLKDKRWSLRNSKIEKEINDFRRRMDDARKLFNDRSLIVVSGGLSAIHQLLQRVHSSQSVIAVALENLKDTLDGQVTQILKDQERRKFLEDRFRARTVEDHSYITQKKKPCHPETRIKILQEIKDWINNNSEEGPQNFLWIVGPPGCGKSALTASITEYCQAHDHLGAQFFISHANRNTTNPLHYFPTVIQDLYRRSESVEQHLHDALKEQKSSVDTPDKAAQLFLDTIGQAAREHPDSPVVVIFDGLDETSSYHDASDQARREDLENTAAIFSGLFAKLSHHRNAKVVISSRPEAEILRHFKDSSAHRQHIKQLEIRTDDENVLHDIDTFLSHRLGEIAKKHQLPFRVWPDVEYLEQLANGASGLFIWAVMACNYIDARLRLRGKQDPNAVFDEFDEKHPVDLRTLYSRILTFSYPEDAADDWDFEVFRRIMGGLMVVQEPMTIHDLDAFLDLRPTSKSTRVDIRNFVENLRTVLVPDSEEVTGDTIPQAHKSFFDLLTSASAFLPVRFRINLNTANAELALLCSRHLIAAYSDVHATHYALKESDLKVLTPTTLYALRYILSHMPHHGGRALGILSDHPKVRDIFQLEDILRRSSHQHHTGPLVFSVQSNPILVRTSFDSHPLLWDPNDGSATSPISRSLDCHDAWFSPDGRRLFIIKENQVCSIRHDSYDLSKSTPLTERLPTHSEPSFNGKEILFATSDGRVSLHNADSGSLILDLPQRDQTFVTLLHISQKASYIVLVSGGFCVEVWDRKNECYINSPNTMRHELKIRGVILSPDETLIVSYTKKQVYLWEVLTSRRLGSFEFEVGNKGSIAISPDSQLVLGGSSSGKVHLWNARTGVPTCTPWISETKTKDARVMGVGFRSCGTVAFTYSLYSLQIWNVHTTSLLTVIPNVYNPTFTADGSQLMSIAYSNKLLIHNLAPILLDSSSTFKPKWSALSPGGRLVVSAAADQILCWRLDAVKVVGDPLQGASGFINVVAFSANESLIAGASEDGTIYLWDSMTQELLSSLPKCAPDVSSLSFSPDGAYILAMRADTSLVALTVVRDELAVSSDVIPKIPTYSKSAFLDAGKHVFTFGTETVTRNRRLEGVRWYPGNSESIVWAYVDNHIVRAGKDGSFVVVPVGDAQHK